MICLLWILTGICLQCILCEGSCEERSHVVGAEGADVILQVDPVGVLGEITWFISGNHFATSESGRDIKIRDSRYKGKVYSTHDGSLLLKDLLRKDQGTYIASSVRSRSGREEICPLIYELRVYEMLLEDNIEIEYEVSSNETCNVTISCSVKASDVTVTWEGLELKDINMTSNTVHIQDPDPKNVYTCKARNPITSASKSIIPWEHCKTESTVQASGSRKISIFKGNGKWEDYTVLNIIRLKLAVCILIITCFIFGHHMKTEVAASSQDKMRVLQVSSLDVQK